jgi:hypothetical protein
MSDVQINARVEKDQKDNYRRAARQLGLDSVSTFVTTALDAASGQILAEGWRCQTVYLQGCEIVGYGPHPPRSGRGVPLPCGSFQLVAPCAFWKRLERELG